MAKFCIKCGKPLVDGKPCDCEQQNVKKEEKIVYEKNNGSGNLVDEVKDIFADSVKKPYSTMLKYQEKDVTLGLILIGLNMVAFGLLVYFFISKGYTQIINAIFTKLQGIFALFGQSSQLNDIVTSAQIKFPFAKIFFLSILSLGIGYLILISLSRLFVGKVFKGKGKFGDYLTVVGLATPVSTMLMLIGVVCAFLSWKLAFVIMIMAMVAFFTMVSRGYLDILSAKEEKFAYAKTITVCLTFILTIFLSLTIFGVMVATTVSSGAYI